MHVKGFGIGVGAVGTAFPVAHGLADIHLLGMGLDLFFDRHDA
jgi:hypothetical protein